MEISDDEAREPSGRHSSIVVDNASTAVNQNASTVEAGAVSVVGTGVDGGVSAGGGGGAGGVATTTGGNMADELDNLMDISMEIASNKRMKKDHIKPFRLTFKDGDMERKYCHQRDYTFKSSLFCLVGVWIVVFASEIFQIQLHNDWCALLLPADLDKSGGSCDITVTLSATAVVAVLLSASLAMVVFESSLPKSARWAPHTLVHHRAKRNATIAFTFLIIGLAAALSVVSFKGLFNTFDD